MSTVKTTRYGIIATATAALLGLAAPALAPAAAQAPSWNSVSSQFSSAVGVANPLDELGRPTPETQARILAFANQPWLPEDARNAILSAVAFSSGTGEHGGPELVSGGPGIKQFYWPTVSGRCIGGVNDSVGSAIAVPGPTEIPAPGAKSGETVFLFTALGTKPAAKKQGRMQVQWFNIDTFASGVTKLHNNGINADGPTTLSAKAKTGKGTVLAVLSGTVNTQESSCNFLPTAAIIEVK